MRDKRRKKIQRKLKEKNEMRGIGMERTNEGRGEKSDKDERKH